MFRPISPFVLYSAILASCLSLATPADACWLRCCTKQREQYVVAGPCPACTSGYICLCKDTASGKYVKPSSPLSSTQKECACRKYTLEGQDYGYFVCWDPALNGWRPAQPGDNPANIRFVEAPAPDAVPQGSDK